MRERPEKTKATAALGFTETRFGSILLKRITSKAHPTITTIPIAKTINPANTGTRLMYLVNRGESWSSIKFMVAPSNFYGNG
jgi:hypothetical protein